MIADTIKLLRTARSMTQADLAKKLNITRSSVNAWEMGISVPSTTYIVELAQLFHVSTDYLLGIEKTPVQSEGRKAKLSCIARLEEREGEITSEMDKNITAYIDFILKREKEEE